MAVVVDDDVAVDDDDENGEMGDVGDSVAA